MESKVVSLRVPEQLLEKLDRLAEKRYPNRKSNRSQVILDAIELIIEQGNLPSNNDDTISISTVNDIVNERIKEYSIDSKNTMNDTVNIEKIEELDTVYDSAYKSPPAPLDKGGTEGGIRGTAPHDVDKDEDLTVNVLSLRSAFELAQSRGYEGKMKTFSGVFTKHKDNSDFSLCGIKRNHKQGKERVTYTDVYDVNS